MTPTGIIPPCVTPMHADESVDLPGLRRHIDWLLESGVDGLCVPLAQKLRSRTVKVYGVGVVGSVSRERRDACDQCVTLTSTGSWPAAVAKFGGGGWSRYSPSAPAVNSYAGARRGQ